VDVSGANPPAMPREVQEALEWARRHPEQAVAAQQQSVPPVPNILDAVRKARTSPTGEVYSPPATVAPPARHAIRNDGVPEPPNVLDVITAQRARGLR
jgi:hypothetical protein